MTCIPVDASFSEQHTAALGIIQRENIFQKHKELKEYVEKQIKNLEKSPIKDCLNRGWFEGQKTAYENILKKLTPVEKNNESSD